MLIDKRRNTLCLMGKDELIDDILCKEELLRIQNEKIKKLEEWLKLFL